MKLPSRFYWLSWSLLLLGITSGLFHASLLWINQKLDESFENISLILLFHSNRASQNIALGHGAVVAVGVFTITSFLFCEIHLIAIILLTVSKMNSIIKGTQVITQGKAGLRRAM